MSNPESVIRSLQRISQFAKDLGIDARQRQRDRTLRREPYLIKKQYPPGIRAVIDKIEHAGMQVSPYNSRLSYRPNVERRSQNNDSRERRGLQCSIAQRPQIRTLCA